MTSFKTKLLCKIKKKFFAREKVEEKMAALNTWVA
jgi:hypothetical protein